MTGIEFSITGILLGLYAFLLIVLFCVVSFRAMVRRKQADAADALRPAIQEAFVNYLAGSNDREPLRTLTKTNREEVADTMMGFKGTIGGGALDRLCDLSMDLTLLHDWVSATHLREPGLRRKAFERLAFVSVYEPCRRVTGEILLNALKDADPEVRVWAAHGITKSDEMKSIEQVFDLAVSQDLMTRVLLTEDLRRYAMQLCERKIPSTLRSPDTPRVLAALEMLVAWGRAIPFEDVSTLLLHSDKRIRVQALRLTPLVVVDGENRAAVVRALADPDEEVNTAAALCAGRLKLEEALPSLARLLRESHADLARAAAAALSEMPPRGWQTLEELSSSPNPATATTAAAALARVKRRAGE